ncbi:MAG: cysteine desulfurase [Candidatus Bostrichicola ureolyticus]|nr:MAG: cysteine desulfurase [Candidatus Bostrichicola ureolyticus]
MNINKKINNKIIYLDNAATTAMRNEVIQTIIKSLKKFGNPSSTHSFGIEIRSLIEESRIIIANIINAYPSEIIFTSGGTEANNMIIRSAIENLNIKHIITSKIEHKSVLETILNVSSLHKELTVEFVNLKEKGVIDLLDLEKKLINKYGNTLVSLMHANNEIGNLMDIKNIGNICKKYNAYFHSDTIQTIGHYIFNMQKLNVDFATASAHKFNGPAGIGFAYIKKYLKLKPIITGGYQERGMRAGMENIYGIIGLRKAIECAYLNLKKDKEKIKKIKFYCIKSLKEIYPNIYFNGLSDDLNKSIHTILNISIPLNIINNELLPFILDLNGIILSQGSACNSNKLSYVIKNINNNNNINLRISFGIFNKKKDIDILINVLKNVVKFY